MGFFPFFVPWEEKLTQRDYSSQPGGLTCLFKATIQEHLIPDIHLSCQKTCYLSCLFLWKPPNLITRHVKSNAFKAPSLKKKTNLRYDTIAAGGSGAAGQQSCTPCAVSAGGEPGGPHGRQCSSPCCSCVLTSIPYLFVPLSASHGRLCTCAQNKCWDGSSPCVNHRGLSWRSLEAST